MKTGLLLFVCLSTFIGTAFGHEYVSTTANKNEIKTISISSEITEIKFSLAGFYKSEVNTQKGKAFVITAKNATQLLRFGAPDLPKFALSLVIPDTKEMQVEVLTSSFVDYPIEVAPSKGNLYRNIDPSTVPFSFGPEYTTDQFFPQSLSFLRAPYILRDFRGETVVIQPFQYNASTKTLRVFTNISFRVLPTGNPGTVNVLNRTSLPHQLDPSFFDIYKNHE